MYLIFLNGIDGMFQGQIVPTEHSVLRSCEGIWNGGQEVTSAATPGHDTSHQMTSSDASLIISQVDDGVQCTNGAQVPIETGDHQTNATVVPSEDFSHLSVVGKPADSDEGLLSSDVT